MKTTISIDKGIRDRLNTFGKKGESYDSILEDLMDFKSLENAKR